MHRQLLIIMTGLFWFAEASLAAPRKSTELFDDGTLPALAKSDPAAAAKKLWEASGSGPLSERMLVLAAELAQDSDPFVAGFAEWAIARRVAEKNNTQTIQWPRANPPEWFNAWQKTAEARALELDYARQAIAAGLDKDSSLLLKSARESVKRVELLLAGRAAGEGDPASDTIHRLAQSVQSDVALLAHEVESAPQRVARHRSLWIRIRSMLRRIILAASAPDLEQLVYVKSYNPHSLRNITGSQYPWTIKPGGDIVILEGCEPASAVRTLIGGRLGSGHVHGMDLSWNADRVVFGFAKQPQWPPRWNTMNGSFSYELRREQPSTRLYEIRLDTRQIRQITDHPVWSDFEPTYCPNGDIAFASDRSGRSSECGLFLADHTVINLYAVAADGSNLRRLNDNKDIDRYPHALDDGTIGYTRWDYQERHFMEIHSLWSVRPDGTMADARFKQHLGAPLSLRDVRSVPGGSKLVAIAAGHHTLAHGAVVVIDPRMGINDASAIQIVTPGIRPQEGSMAGVPVEQGGVRDAGGIYQTPWALSDRAFLVSYAYDGAKEREGTFGLYYIDVYGNKELICRDPLLSCLYPIPLKQRPTPPVLPDSTDRTKDHAVCQISDVYEGWRDIPRGAVKYIRISQRVGWPLDEKIGAMRWIPGNAFAPQYGFWSWAPARTIGTVKVEEDGSAHFKVPVNQAVYFQALDENRMELRRMRSHVTFQPGETRSCGGCHETQSKAPARVDENPLAMRRDAETPTPPPWGNRKLLGYEWLVQPVLDQHCIRCHSADKPGGGLDLSSTRQPDGFLQSFHSLFPQEDSKKPSSKWVSVSDRFSGSSVSAPMQFGSHKSRFVTVLLSDELHRREVKLAPAQWEALVTWVDANAPYYDTFYNKRPGEGMKPVRQIRLELGDPFQQPASDREVTDSRRF